MANHCDKHGRSAFYLAALHGHTESCRVILEHPRFVAIDTLACDGSSALEAATLAGHQETRQMLLQVNSCNTLPEHRQINVQR